MLWGVEEITIDLSSSVPEQLDALRACGCSHVSYSLPSVGDCALRHVSNEQAPEAVSMPASGWKCLRLFKCQYCATDFRARVIIAGPNQVSMHVDTWHDFANGPDRGSAQDELFNSSPWRPHVDDYRLRDPEKLCMEGSQLVLSNPGGICDGLQPYLIAQDNRWYSRGEKRCLNQSADF
jgi:hypothetical protein